MRIRSMLLLPALALAACHTSHPAPAPGATAVVHSSAGDSIGVLSFYGSETDNTVRITGTLRGLAAGSHGIHLHAVGTCEGPVFVSAGPHVNPGSRHHGLDNPDGPHAGDLPNISADASGVAQVNLTTTRVTIASLKDADGSSIVVHAGVDDQHTDPAGGSGARIACGVIR